MGQTSSWERYWREKQDNISVWTDSQSFKKESLVQEVFGQYMKDNYFTKANLDQSSFSLNMAACQLVLDICS